ncbi:MAG: 4'-phosphopantetheinyl transferase superfamily protein [Gammaproteobacteria bacterium]
MHSDIQIMLMDFTVSTQAQLEWDLLPRLYPLEQDRYRTFTSARRRHLWLMGRALLLAALTRRLGHADAAALRTDKLGGVRYHHGAPHLSLSHCRDMLAAALSSVRIGVDIEWPRARTALQHAARIFPDAEARQLETLPDAERQAAFYTLWTLKEAAAKAAGISLWDSLHSACFDLQAGSFRLTLPFISDGWTFMHAHVEPAWQLAVAAHGGSTAFDIECWRMTAAKQWRKQTLLRPTLIHDEHSRALPHYHIGG